MYLSNISDSYFNGINEIYNYKTNSYIENAVSICKIISYATIIIPLAFVILYPIDSLCQRVCWSQAPSAQAIRIQNISAPILPFSQQKQPIDLSIILNLYQPQFRPNLNLKNLQNYYLSDDYERHAATALIYYNATQLKAPKDALRIVYQREPTNIAMGKNQYNKSALSHFCGYETSVYNDTSAKKADGSAFADLPNSVAVYSETFLWPKPGTQHSIEIACLSLPAPALDSPAQPNYRYYMQNGTLDLAKYETEMAFLFQCIERAIRDNYKTAFNNQGFKRIILCKFGQGAFLGCLTPDDRLHANTAYKYCLQKFIIGIHNLGLNIVMSEYSQPQSDAIWYNKIVVGDILQTAQQHDFIVNAWDPHAAPGNGNDSDRSFDGSMGKGSGILVTQTTWCNPHLCQETALVAISSAPSVK